MEDIKLNVAKNLNMLRARDGLTQAELAEKLNYSDKAVSKWERGESVPDIAVLKQIADLFGLSIDALISADALEYQPPAAELCSKEGEEADSSSCRYLRRNRFIISSLSVLSVWFLALLVAVIIYFSMGKSFFPWICFASAVPPSFIVALVFNSIWGSKRVNFLIVSGLMWSVLCLVYCALISFSPWQIFLLGIPGQIAVLLSFAIKGDPQRKKKKK